MFQFIANSGLDKENSYAPYVAGSNFFKTNALFYLRIDDKQKEAIAKINVSVNYRQ